ncbi:MAG: arginase, partial [Caulobacteraceae bacterium]
MVDTGTAKRIELIGLATDAGASARGATMGPEALRIAELAETLQGLGHTVIDHGDFRPEESGPKPERRRAEILAVANHASNTGLDVLNGGGLPVFLGGDHSISMGSVSGVARWCAERGQELFVLWFDAHG